VSDLECGHGTACGPGATLCHRCFAATGAAYCGVCYWIPVAPDEDEEWPEARTVLPGGIEVVVDPRVPPGSWTMIDVLRPPLPLMCTCGHQQTIHYFTGWGSCAAPDGCRCERFVAYAGTSSGEPQR